MTDSFKLVGAVSGFPEYLPKQQRGFAEAVARVQAVYEAFGFTPLETAAVERAETLLAKGIEAKEVYGLRRMAAEGSEGDKDIALRFDLTVPLARYVVQNQNELVFPFRRYQVQPVWRGERAQAGRYRQFYQFDIDTIGDGALPLAADAEVLAAGAKALQALEVGDFVLRVNNRKLLAGLLRWAGFAGDDQTMAIKLIDDAEKVGWEKTEAALAALGSKLSGPLVQVLRAKEPLRVLQEVELDEEGRAGLTELQQVLALAKGMGTAETNIRADLTIARGLDYYTGTVVETRLAAAPELGSIMSGGRYDNLAANLGKKPMPGVGISIGISRLCSWLLAQEPYASMAASPAAVLLACQDETLLPHYATVAQQLRAAGVKLEQTFGGKLATQLKNADKKGLRYALIIGEQEAANGTATLKDFANGTQEVLPLDEVAKRVA
ncbi:MAG: histidine--tRNA ligase [Pseudomonadaceae bacterium]|nr:histidine--tRNA ligase [Pseudomonadaceae bacterium]